MIADCPMVLRFRHIAAQTFGRDSFGAERCCGGFAFFRIARTDHDDDAKFAEFARGLQSEAAIGPCYECDFLFGAHLLELRLNHPNSGPVPMFRYFKSSLWKTVAKFRPRSWPGRKIVRPKNRPRSLEDSFAPRNEVYESSQRCRSGKLPRSAHYSRAAHPQ